MRIKTFKATIIGSLIAFGSLNIHAQEAESKVIEDPRISKLMTLKSEMISNNELADRYKIQIMGFGNVSDANEILDKYNQAIDKWPASIAYQSPNYKVWVGHYANRLEADRALLVVKKEFPNAFIFQPK